MTNSNEINAILADNDASATLRSMLINYPEIGPNADYECDLPTYAICAELTESLFADDRTQRELLTETALSLSLCPIHMHDYAICFDDAICFESPELDDATRSADYTHECSQIRMIHPLHDT